MKKVLSIVLTAMMLLSMVSVASALTVGEFTGSYLAENIELELSLDVKGRQSGTSNEYAAALPLVLEDYVGASVGVDYKTTLYMDTVRAMFDKKFINEVLPDDQQMREEFNAGTVTTAITVKITIPDGAVFDSTELRTAGNLTAGSIFREVSRNINGNVATIAYKNSDNLRVEELLNNVEEYLGDITFELEDVISYTSVSEPQISVEFSGNTIVSFETRTQEITYIPVTATHIATITESITEHLLEVVPAVSATCDTPGTTESIKCKFHGYECADTHNVQGIVLPETIPALGHPDLNAATIVYFENILATCSTKGVLEHKTCILCKQDFDMSGNEIEHETIIVPATGNHIERTIAGKDATCTVAGLTTGKECSICEKVIVKQEIVPALGHQESILAAVEATCTTEGKTEGKECSRCHIVLEPRKIIAATGHSYNNVWQENAQEGYKERTCLNGCGTTERVNLPAPEHTHAIDAKAAVVVPATCAQTGTRTNYCACGQQMGNPEVLPMIDHTLTHVEKISATCTTEGRMPHWACSMCGKFFRNANAKKEILEEALIISIDKKNHGGNKVTINAVEATCEHEGLTEGEKCKACNVITKQQRVKPKKDHVFEIIELEAGCETTGIVTHRHCAVCDKDFDKSGKEKPSSYFVTPANGHSYNDITVTQQPGESTTGQGIITCKNCDHNIIVEISATGHIHNEISEENVIAATCTKTGLKRQIYSCCGEEVEGKQNIVVDVLGHDPVRVAKVESTCHKEGVVEHYECSRCREVIELKNGKWEIAANKTPDTIGKKSHRFNRDPHDDTYNVCEHCNERIKISKDNHSNNKVDIKGHGGLKDEKDIVREQDINYEVESEIIVTKKPDYSDKVDTLIPEDASTHTSAVYDIEIEKTTTEKQGGVVVDEDKEIVSETEDIIEIEIDISELIGKIQYNVFRVHNGASEEIKKGYANRNDAGEYYEVTTNTATVLKITLHVKKFSEYAVVAFEEETEIIVPETPSTPSVDGGSGGGFAPSYTVKFRVDGGIAVSDIKVISGSKITAPVTTKEGYIFKGWYTDTELTHLFDFTTPIKSNMTLYAAWEIDTGAASGWFIDVKETDWFYGAVKYAFDNGIMNGVSETEFAPNANVTRAMFVTVLYRIEKEPEAVGSVFTDVELNSWYDKAVAWATENGITNGVSETEFAPHRIILREQIAAMLYRYAQFKGYDVSAGENTNILSYEDVETISEYAVPSFQWAVGEGVLKGRSETTLNPKENATRAEAAALLMRMIEKYTK